MMRGFRPLRPAAVTAAALLLLFGGGGPGLSAAYTLDPNNTDSIKSTARLMTDDMMSFYTGDKPGQTPGLLPGPYYWWEAGAMMGALVDYWYYTGDSTYNNVTEQGLLFQVGPNNDYMPPNQTVTEGNDDQGFWGLAVMSAAEVNFPNPGQGKPQWLALAQAVFNTQAARWDEADCGGGLRWQIFQFNNGYDYKNSISQACFFQLAARLALYTGNQSYADWAVRSWDWMNSSRLLDPDTYFVYDGAHVWNCSGITPYQWSYNAGGFLLGAAAMYNLTNSTVWRQRVDGLLYGIGVFFTGDNGNIMTEVACEPVNLCDLDQQSFKAYLSRWLAATTKWAPWTYPTIKPLVSASAVAASRQCSGGANGRMCGLRWTDDGRWDGSSGVGQQMAAMEVVLANLIHEVKPPVTSSTGGTSVGDPAAGGSDVGRVDPYADLYVPITAADRAGAAICTLILVAGILVAFVFMCGDLGEGGDDGGAVGWLRRCRDDVGDVLFGAPAAAAVVLVKGGKYVRRRRGAARRPGDFSDDKDVERSESDRSLALPAGAAIVAHEVLNDKGKGVPPPPPPPPRRISKPAPPPGGAGDGAGDDDDNAVLPAAPASAHGSRRRSVVVVRQRGGDDSTRQSSRQQNPGDGGSSGNAEPPRRLHHRQRRSEDGAIAAASSRPRRGSTTTSSSAAAVRRRSVDGDALAARRRSVEYHASSGGSVRGGGAGGGGGYMTAREERITASSTSSSRQRSRSQSVSLGGASRSAAAAVVQHERAAGRARSGSGSFSVGRHPPD